MRNGWMEEKLGEDRSDSFVAMRLEKLKIKDPINSFRRCPFYLFLSVQHSKICRSIPCSFYVSCGLKQKWVSKEMTNFQNNLLTLRGSCVLNLSYVLIHESARQRNIGLSSSLFISLTTDLHFCTMSASTVFSEFRTSRKARCCPVYCSSPYCFKAGQIILKWVFLTRIQQCFFWNREEKATQLWFSWTL